MCNKIYLDNQIPKGNLKGGAIDRQVKKRKSPRYISSLLSLLFTVLALEEKPVPSVDCYGVNE